MIRWSFPCAQGRLQVVKILNAPCIFISHAVSQSCRYSFSLHNWIFDQDLHVHSSHNINHYVYIASLHWLTRLNFVCLLQDHCLLMRSKMFRTGACQKPVVLCILLHCWISTPSTRAWPAIAGFDWQSLHISICSSCPFMCTPNAVNSLLVLDAMSLDCSYQLTLSETDDGLSQLCLMYCLSQFVRAIGIGRHWCRSAKHWDQDGHPPSIFTAIAGVAFLLTWQQMCTQSPACEWCGT